MSLSAIQARNQAIGAANAFTKKSLDGLGALKGANLEVTNIAYNDTDNRTEVEVSWTSNSGAVESDTVYLPYGVSVVSVRVDDEGKSLIFTNSKGVDLSPVPLPDQLKVKISKADGNILEEKADGLYVPATGVEISKEDGNKLSEKADGLYVSGVDVPTKVSQLENDSNFASTGDIPTKTSQLTNDSSFVTESDLTAKNYADKTYVGEQIAQSEHLKREIVDVLPEPSVADEHTIYMLKDDSVTGNDKFKEYMLIEGVVQCVGDTSVDLTDYAKKTDIPTELPANGGNSDTVNNHTVKSDVPENAVFTDTIYSDATQIEHGLMSVDDKKKLDGLTKYTPDGNTIEVSEDATIRVSSKALTFADHDTDTSGTSFTDAEDGNMLVTDWTKNLLNPTLQTTTSNGVTCTRNVDANGKPDGTYTLNGTATDNFNLYLCEPEFTKLTKGKEYRAILYSNILNGLVFDITNNIDEGHNSDKIYGYNFICNGDEYPYGCEIVIHSGTVFNNVLIKPMLTTDLNATYDDFVPYGGYDIKTCGKNLMSVNDATNGATLDAQDRFNFRIRGLDKGNIASDRIYLLKNGVMKGHQSFTFEVTIDEPYGIAIKHNGSTKDIDIEYINHMVRKGTYTISFDVASNNPSVEGGLLLHNIQLEHGGTATDFEPYTGETITVTNDTESPAFGLKSHKGITNIISPGNVKCVYPTNDSGKGVLDSLYNKDKMLTEQNKSLEVLGKCKNLLNPTLETETHNGVTFTKNDDGTYSLSGSRTDTSSSAYISFIIDYPLEKGRYKLTGALDENNNIRCIIKVSGSENKNIYDYGKGVVLDISKPNTTITLMIVSTDDTSQTRIVKPMLTTDLNATYNDFVPYTGDGETLASDVAEINKDLGGLTFSASGTTLSITDGTNTWTLEANN